MITFHRPMGRDVTGLHIVKMPSTVNVKSNGTNNGAVYVTPIASSEKAEMKDYEANDHNQKQDVIGTKSTNHAPKEKIIRPESQNSIEKKLSSPARPGSGSTNGTTDANSSEVVTTTVVDDKQPISPSMSAKLQHPQHDKYYDADDDNWSLASSTATTKSKITVPVAPKFTCVNRLERRKEYYSKLEEKHKALEKEKIDYEARTKEEEAAAIKLLRKNMSYKANPLPSFYNEAPPLKPELKKLPVTRAKSPNFTQSRRKSCGDAVRASTEDKGLQGRAVRRSVESLKEARNTSITPRGKDRIGRKLNETSRNIKNSPKETKQTTGNPKVKA